jgi:DNA-binding transcriptional MerR regulator
MEPSDRTRSLTPELIRQLLDSQVRAERSADYVRLMEIYCVVKAGGVAAQVEVAQRLEQAERAELQQEIDSLVDQSEMAGRVRALQQEIQEVERSVANRLAYLQSIDPQEEISVRSCMPLIDGYFANLGQAHD